MAYKFTAGCGMKNRQLHVLDVTRTPATLTRGNRGKHLENGTGGIGEKIVAENQSGIEKTATPVRVDQEIWKVEKLRNKFFEIAAFGVD